MSSGRSVRRKCYLKKEEPWSPLRDDSHGSSAMKIAEHKRSILHGREKRRKKNKQKHIHSTFDKPLISGTAVTCKAANHLDK
jgi:hypothetical protein